MLGNLDANTSIYVYSSPENLLELEFSMQPAKESKKADTKRVNPYPVTVISIIVYDESNKPVVETFFLGTYSNPSQSEQGTRLFYTYVDLRNDRGDTVDLVGTEVDLDYTKQLQITNQDPNKPPGRLHIFRNFPERWVSSTSPAAGHIPNVDVTGGADTATGKLDP